VGWEDGTDSLPPRGVQIGIKQLFATMASLWAVPYERKYENTRKNKSHLGFSESRTRCPLGTITPSLVVSSRCLVLPASTPHTPSPPLQRCLFLTGSAAAGRCSNRKSSVLSLPSWKKIWVELRLVSHKPHGRYWGPCVCTADHGPGACAQHLQHRLLQHTVTSPIGAEEAMQ
jgi:hypothetical protein